MSSRPALIGASQPQIVIQTCDFCHQKPKYNNHQYCSKSCASQAAALCNHCHKKPKYQNYNFCSKACAASAGGKSTNPASKGQGNNQAMDPMQIAKLIMQHFPQLQTIIPLPPQNGTNQATISSNSNQRAAPVTPPKPKSKPQNNPFMDPNNIVSTGNGNPMLAGTTSTGGGGQVPQAILVPRTAAPPALSLNTMNLPPPTTCLIPGCNQPVYQEPTYSSTGSVTQKPSQYCSQKHREEAVASGLVSPCIFCMTFPQSEKDYFCGRECRDEALDKNLVVVPQAAAVPQGYGV